MTLLKQAQEVLKIQGANLQCTDFKHIIEITHSDGSHFVFRNAIAKPQIVDGVTMLFVWTEHCGYHVFFYDDLTEWKKRKEL